MSHFYTLGRRTTIGATRYPRPVLDRDTRAAERAARAEAAGRDLEQAELFLLSLEAEMLAAERGPLVDHGVTSRSLSIRLARWPSARPSR